MHSKSKKTTTMKEDDENEFNLLEFNLCILFTRKKGDILFHTHAMEKKIRVHSLETNQMITAGKPLTAYSPSSRTQANIPADLRLVPYHMLHKDENAKATWNRILRSKYSDRFFLRKIDSMAMYLVHCNMLASISSKQVTSTTNNVARANVLWANSMKRTVLFHAETAIKGKKKAILVNTSAIYVILEFLAGSPSSWNQDNTKPSSKKSKKRKHCSKKDDASDEEGDEESEALEMWKSPDVKNSVPTTMLNLKFVCKELYKMIDWRAISFAFQRYVHPAFKINSKEEWDDVAYFRDYVLRRCMIPDYPPEIRGSISISAMQPLIHRYANFCYKRLSVVMFYTRTASVITRRIFFVGDAVVDKNGVPNIKPRPMSKQPHHWNGVKEIRGDLIQRNGVIHVGASQQPGKYLANPSGWNVLEPRIYMIAESQEVFCGTTSKIAIEKIEFTDLVEPVKSKSKKEREEEEEEEGEEDEFESHDGWLEFDDQHAEVAKGEDEYVNPDDDCTMAKRGPLRRSRRILSTHTSADWLREEEEEDAIPVIRKKHGKIISHGLMDEARNEIDDMECEEEYEDDDEEDEAPSRFKSKRRK